MANLTNPADLRIESVFIESHTEVPKRIDITDLFISMNIVESLYNPLLKANILLSDASAILSNLPVVGQEKIEILVSKNDVEKTYKFRTTHVSKQSPTNDFTVVYDLTLVQEDFFLNSVTLISQSFNGSMSSIIGTIYDDFLDTEIDAEESAGNYSVVVPRWNPFRAITWCMERARSDDNAPMVLYNTLNGGVKMRSLKTLFEADPVESYYRRRANEPQTQEGAQRGDHGRYDDMMQTPLRFLALETGPILEQLHNGAFGSRTKLIDLKSKRIQTFEFNYEEQFDRMPHISSERVYGDQFLLNGNTPATNPYTRQSVYAYSSGASNGMTYNEDVLNTTPFRQSFLQTMNSYRWRLNVYGRFDLEVGSIVDLNINKNRVYTENDVDETKDERRSGKYIITALKHIITRTGGQGQYTINFDCARETMEKKYDDQV
jgi:hypothetical protein